MHRSRLPILPLLLALWPGACARPSAERMGAERLTYEDFLTNGRLVSSQGAVEPAEGVCAFENRWGVRLMAEEELSASFTLGSSASLLIAGCVGRFDAPPPAQPGADRLELVVETAGGTRHAAPLTLSTAPGPFQERIALELPAGEARLSLAPSLGSGRRVYLRDLAVRHSLAPPPPDAGGEPRPRERAQQILLISIDTLREDALSHFGGPWATPALDGFAERAQGFRPHYAAASWTKPSHASLLSGQSPAAHGATEVSQPLPKGLTLLSERFQRAGFETAGMVTDCLWLNPPFGFSRGFDEYRSVRWNLPQMARAAVNWMAERREQPFFFFLHSFEAHSDFRVLPYEGPGITRRTVEERFGVTGYGCREEQCASGLLSEISAGRIRPLPNEEAILRFLYGEGVRHVDAELGRLFADLEELGLFDDMLIVLTSDHGEQFFEHGELLHGQAWNEVMRVPLLVKWPRGRRAGVTETAPTSALDVAPTLLAAGGLAAEGLPGRDLAGPLHGEPVFAWDPGAMVMAGDLKAVFRLRDGRPRLFDLAADPGERHDLTAERPADLARLERLLATREAADRAIAARLAAEPGSPGLEALSKDDIARLKALGYLGGPAAAEHPE